MKKFILSLVVFVFTLGLSFSQSILSIPNGSDDIVPKRNCGQMEYMAKLEIANPSLKEQRIQLEKWTKEWIATHQDEINNNKAVITIPVVFHIVYKAAAENVTDARVQEAISQLNRDYAGLNPHSMGVFSASLKANTNFQFCLAQRKPDGTATTGIDRVLTTSTSFVDDDRVKSSTTGGANAWDVSKYLNIWVCNLGSNLCGYGQFPYAAQGGGINSTYGLVIMYKYFGATGAVSPYNNGGTSTHEIGHCFNLFHSWGDDNGACSGSDNVADTPNAADANYADHTGLYTDACTSTSPGVLYQNFMDYTNDASYACFTPGQAARMQALFASGGPLYSLTTSNACTPPASASVATVTTTAASAIATTTATSGGNVTSIGSSAVTAKGVCWATTLNPTIANSKTSNGTGIGSFTSAITGLTAGTLYHVRAYATNTSGTAYGADVTFTTTASATLATVTTTAASAIATTTATSGGNVTSIGSSAVTAKGVCWSTTLNPTIANSKTSNGTGIGSFTSAITGLTASTLYHVRAYATNTSGTAYGADVTFTTTAASSSTCPTPSGMITSLITSTGAQIAWTSTGAASYTIKFKAVSATTWTTSTATGTARTLYQLTPATAYQWQVMGTCTASSSTYTSLATFTTLGSTSCGTDIYETNETLATSKLISTGTSIKALICTSTDVDWYKISNTATYPNIKVDLSTLPGDYDLYLCNSAGTILYKSENGSTTAEKVIYNSAPVGTYYIKVIGYNGATSTTTYYTLLASRSATAFAARYSGDSDSEKEESLKSQNLLQDINIYPNPANNIINVIIPNSVEINTTLSLTDLIGRTLKVITAEPGSVNSISIEDLATGLYFLRAESGKMVEIRKIQVTK